MSTPELQRRLQFQVGIMRNFNSPNHGSNLQHIKHQAKTNLIKSVVTGEYYDSTDIVKPQAAVNELQRVVFTTTSIHDRNVTLTSNRNAAVEKTARVLAIDNSSGSLTTVLQINFRP